MNENLKLIAQIIKKRNYIYIIGNGGSASTANHFANDLVKLAGVKAISLCSNEAIVMAYANDNGYENIFIDQLKVFLKPNDMLITISGSGTSPNIVKAIEYAKKNEFVSVYSFPTMDQLKCDMQQTENKHLELAHLIAMEVSKL